jgi:hypothetical protein
MSEQKQPKAQVNGGRWESQAQKACEFSLWGFHMMVWISFVRGKMESHTSGI